MIAREFQRMKTIREIELNHNIIAFLDDIHASLNEKGATNPIGPFKRSLFHYAAMGDCTELIRFLLQNGAAVDCRDQNKRTPLSWAAEYGALNTVKILLENGAEINSTDDMFWNGSVCDWFGGLSGLLYRSNRPKRGRTGDT